MGMLVQMLTSLRRRALFFVNRNARRGAEKIGEAQGLLEAAGFELVEIPSYRPADMTAIICDKASTVDCVIMGGGDGTLNSALEGLVKTKLPLGILPLGTANDLAKTLAISTSLSEACEHIVRGHLRRIDIGRVNEKYFFNEAGCGLSAKLARALSKEQKGTFGVLAVGMSGLQILSDMRPFRAEIRCNGDVLKVRTAHLMIGNGKNFGGWLKSHDAAIDDHKLDLYSLEIRHAWEVVKIIPGMLQGRYVNSPGVRLIQAQEFEVRTSRPLRIDTDGELTTMTPAVFRVLPQAIAIFAHTPPE
ncbi:MAG: lipid kinase [Candidatus Eremiobacter antarcticus]